VKLLQLCLVARVVAHWIGCYNQMEVRVNDSPKDRRVLFLVAIKVTLGVSTDDICLEPRLQRHVCY
jgi:hypothetical protein